MLSPRDYQAKLNADVYGAWDAGAQIVAGVMPTGGGKTVCFSTIMREHNAASIAVAHRREIVGQISLALGVQEVKHRIIAPAPILAMVRRRHLEKLGRSWIDPNSRNGVASVQTLTSKSSERNRELQRWIKQVTLGVFDEGHHYVDSGSWGKAVRLFGDTKQLHVTACPERADGKGLGRHASGFVDAMVEGPTTAELIARGYLAPFKYIAPTSDLNVEDVPLTATGDVNTREMRKRIKQSHIVGDVVAHYRKHAPGKKCIVFANDVETAGEIAQAFRDAAVPALALSGDSDVRDRERGLHDFETGALNVLVNVDLFDEGFDVPAVECAILARVTESLNKFLQMVGRALRVMEGKTHAIVIDPVRNWERHGMPNWPRVWSLDDKEKGSRGRAGDLIAQKVCTACTQPYEAFYAACPYCGHVIEPGGRGSPEQVEGDLTELDVDGMAAMLEMIRRADMPRDEYAVDQIERRIPPVGRGPDMRRHEAAKYRRGVLRNLIAWWCGAQRGRSQSEVYRRFNYRFGIDMATALTLSANDTDALIALIKKRFAEDVIL